MKLSKKFKQRLFRTRPEDALPLTIHHKRIYILPSKRGWVFLASLLLMLVSSINYALSLGYALSFLLTGLFAATLLETYKNLAGVTIESVNGKNVFAGEQAEFTIGLSSGTDIKRHDIEIMTTDASNICTISPDSHTHCSLTIRTKKRGEIKLGRLTLKSRYPLGLWYTWCYLHSPTAIIAYPTPEANPPPLPLLSTDSDGDKAKQDRSGDVAGLREYQPGDTPSHIAWKSLARGQGLQVKTFENEQQGGEVMLTQHATKHHELEAQLSRLSAWVIAAERNQSQYALTLNDNQLPLDSGTAHKNLALESLALHGLVR